MAGEKVRSIFLCRTVKRYSKKYGGETHCTAGILFDEEESFDKWLRLYPLYPEACRDIRKWDIIETGVDDWNPERRTESIRAVPDDISKINRIQSKERRKEILINNCKSGDFLHMPPSKTKGSLRLTMPLFPRFYREKNLVWSEFFCDFEDCSGHKFEVLDTDVHREPIPDQYRKGKIFFLFGTHRYVPFRWLLISVMRLN